MFFSKASAVALTSFLQFLAVSGAPIVIPRATQSPSLASLSKPVISPYYLYFGNPSTAKLADAFDSVGLKAATLGFASAPKGQCSLTSDLNSLVSDVQAYIAKGGAVTLSFGGNLQDPTVPRQHVQQACTDVPSLVKLIEGAMSTFGTHNIDFDIEDNDLLSDTASAQRLGSALVQVKKDFSDTFISYTVGSNPSGMPSQQNAYVQAAQSAGLSIDTLNLMTMNMGGSNIVSDAQTAVTGAAAQLEKIYELQNGQGLSKMGMLPSIGVDNNGQTINLTDIATLANFVNLQGMARFSYWSFNRDFPGDPGSTTQSLDDSSSADQTTASQFLTTINGAIAAPTVPPTFADKLVLHASASSSVNTPPPPPPANNQQPGQKASLPSFLASAAPQGAAGAEASPSAGLNGTASTLLSNTVTNSPNASNMATNSSNSSNTDTSSPSSNTDTTSSNTVTNSSNSSNTDTSSPPSNTDTTSSNTDTNSLSNISTASDPSASVAAPPTRRR